MSELNKKDNSENTQDILHNIDSIKGVASNCEEMADSAGEALESGASSAVATLSMGG
jgi:hypothetical protein